MPVFKTFIKIAKKHMGAAFIYIAIFMIMCVMFTQSGSKQEEDYQMAKCQIAVFDRDNSEASKKLVEYIKTNNELITDLEDDDEIIQDKLYYRSIDYVLYIEEGYQTTGELSNIKRIGTTSGAYIDNQISMYESSINALVKGGYDYDEAYEITLKSLDREGLVESIGETGGKPSIYHFYLYAPYVLVMVMLMVLAPVIVVFNEKETKDRLEVSSYSHKKKQLELYLGVVLFSIFVLCSFFILDFALSKGKLNSTTDMFSMTNMLVFTIVAASLTAVIGNFNVKPSSLDVISNVIGLGMAFLGGVFVPLEYCGKGLQSIAKFIPTYWYVHAQDLIYGNCDKAEIYQCYIVELIFAIAFFAVAMVVSKRNKFSVA